MEKKQRFFIYDRKEVGVLLLLGVMVAVFAFTLGVHLGKRVTGKAAPSAHATPTLGVSPVAEVPSTAETEQAMVQPTAVPSAMMTASEDAVNQATHDEVTRTGIRLEDSRQLELPEKTRSANAGATNLSQPSDRGEPHAQPTEQKHAVSHENAPSAEKHAEAPHAVENAAEENEAPSEAPSEVLENPQQNEALAELKALNEKAHHAASPKKKSSKVSSRYTLQIGSFSNQKEAQDRVKDLEISGLSPRIHATDLKSKGRWYRIYLGGFTNKAAAEKAGKKYRAQGVIDSFIVAKSVE